MNSGCFINYFYAAKLVSNDTLKKDISIAEKINEIRSVEPTVEHFKVFKIPVKDQKLSRNKTVE